jgi:uncharacterized membrane protein YeiB
MITRTAEFRIALFGFLAAFVWEMWQMPFYDQSGLTFMNMVQGCSLGSLGDAGIMVCAYCIAAWTGRSRQWLASPTPRALAVYLATGLIITIAIEHIAINFQFGWRYGYMMPVEPIFGTGLVPIVMWIAVPLATLWLARLPGPSEKSGHHA